MGRRILLVALVTAGMALPATAEAAGPTLGQIAGSEVGSESALLEGAVNPNGLATSYRFEYVDLATFSPSGFASAVATPTADAGSGVLSLEVSAPLTGLVPDTTYFFRLRATNSSGTVESNPTTFSTSHGPELECEGDDCQVLPPAPVDPTLTTLLVGLGNPKVHYHRLNHFRPRKKKGAKQHQAKKHPIRHKGGR
jgi:hypothetical protein